MWFKKMREQAQASGLPILQLPNTGLVHRNSTPEDNTWRWLRGQDVLGIIPNQ